MAFVTGFLIWLAFGLLAAAIIRGLYRAPGTMGVLTFVLAIFGAFIGGMLGMYPYIFHEPVPTRPGGLIGALAGAFFFGFLYHFMARKAV
ncbi:MAG TPA: hypothetical protein VF188_13820 [Longimicrobiales bacterium]